MILLAGGNQPIGEVLTSELIAQEIVRSAVGTIGLIAAVPITTALAAVTARRTAAGGTGRDEAGRGDVGRRRARHRFDDYEVAWNQTDDEQMPGHLTSGHGRG